MAHIRLLNKNGEQVAENTQVRSELTGSLTLPRVIQEQGSIFRFSHYEGNIAVYVESN